MEKGVQHDSTTQLTRIPAASTGDNQAETGRRTNITSGTGIGGRSPVLGAQHQPARVPQKSPGGLPTATQSPCRVNWATFLHTHWLRGRHPGQRPAVFEWLVHHARNRRGLRSLVASGQSVPGLLCAAREVGKLLILNPVGVNIGVKPRFSWPLGMEVAEIEPSLVGPVGIEPTTCGLKVRCSRFYRHPRFTLKQSTYVPPTVLPAPARGI